MKSHAQLPKLSLLHWNRVGNADFGVIYAILLKVDAENSFVYYLLQTNVKHECHTSAFNSMLCLPLFYEDE